MEVTERKDGSFDITDLTKEQYVFFVKKSKESNLSIEDYLVNLIKESLKKKVVKNKE